MMPNRVDTHLVGKPYSVHSKWGELHLLSYHVLCGIYGMTRVDQWLGEYGRLPATTTESSNSDYCKVWHDEGVHTQPRTIFNQYAKEMIRISRAEIKGLRVVDWTSVLKSSEQGGMLKPAGVGYYHRFVCTETAMPGVLKNALSIKLDLEQNLGGFAEIYRCADACTFKHLAFREPKFFSMTGTRRAVPVDRRKSRAFYQFGCYPTAVLMLCIISSFGPRCRHLRFLPLVSTRAAPTSQRVCDHMFHPAIRRTADIRGCDRSIRHNGVEPCAFDLESRYVGSDSPDIVVRDIAPIVRNTVKILVIEPDGRCLLCVERIAEWCNRPGTGPRGHHITGGARTVLPCGGMLTLESST